MKTIILLILIRIFLITEIYAKQDNKLSFAGIDVQYGLSNINYGNLTCYGFTSDNRAINIHLIFGADGERKTLYYGERWSVFFAGWYSEYSVNEKTYTSENKADNYYNYQTDSYGLGGGIGVRNGKDYPIASKISLELSNTIGIGLSGLVDIKGNNEKYMNRANMNLPDRVERFAKINYSMATDYNSSELSFRFGNNFSINSTYGTKFYYTSWVFPQWLLSKVADVLLYASAEWFPQSIIEKEYYPLLSFTIRSLYTYLISHYRLENQYMPFESSHGIIQNHITVGISIVGFDK